MARAKNDPFMNDTLKVGVKLQSGVSRIISVLHDSFICYDNICSCEPGSSVDTNCELITDKLPYTIAL